MSWPNDYWGFQVRGDREQADGPIEQEVALHRLAPSDQVADDQVLVSITHSSINYKDALAATGHPGVARVLPLIPGIDAAGQVLHSKSPAWREGDRVMISAEAFGTAVDGGWRQLAWVPADWLIPIPNGLSPLEACALGTAGITAAWCVGALAELGCLDRPLPLLVTGASGGVGSLAVEILGKRLGQNVTAVTGKLEMRDRLLELGAGQVMSREEFIDTTSRPLLSARWAGGIDTLGSSGLATLLRSTAEGGCVAACGLVAGPELNLTVYPFILRGVILYGIDCTRYSQAEKSRQWQQLADAWLPQQGVQEARMVTLDQVSDVAFAMLEGRHQGRCVVQLPPLTAAAPEAGPANLN